MQRPLLEEPVDALPRKAPIDRPKAVCGQPLRADDLPQPGRDPAQAQGADRFADDLTPDFPPAPESETAKPRPNNACAVATRAPIAAGALLLSLGVSACTVGNNHHAPPVAVGALQSVGTVDSRKTDAPPLDSWWTGFDDPELTRIVRRAIGQNLDLAAALARVEQARAAAAAVGAQAMPPADPTGPAARLRQSSDSSIGAGASWELDLFGGLRRGDEAEAAEAAHFGTLVSVAADAADAYFRIRGDQTRIVVALDQISNDRHLLDFVRLRFGKGLATDREAAQAEALLAQAQASLEPLRIELETQLNRLDMLVGAPPGTYAAELQAPAPIPAAPAIPTDGHPAELLRRRPDVIAAERRLASSNAHIGQAVAAYYPQVSLSGLLGFESLDADHLVRATAFKPEAAAGLRWRLFDFGKVDAEVAQARGAEAEALAQYRQSILHAAEDVETAFTTLVQSAAHGKDLVSKVAALRRTRDFSEQAYRGGLTGLTEALDADRELLVAQDRLAQSRADTARAAVQAFRALGGGWSA